MPENSSNPLSDSTSQYSPYGDDESGRVSEISTGELQGMRKGAAIKSQPKPAPKIDYSPYRYRKPDGYPDNFSPAPRHKSSLGSIVNNLPGHHNSSPAEHATVVRRKGFLRVALIIAALVVLLGIFAATWWFGFRKIDPSRPVAELPVNSCQVSTTNPDTYLLQPASGQKGITGVWLQCDAAVHQKVASACGELQEQFSAAERDDFLHCGILDHNSEFPIEQSAHAGSVFHTTIVGLKESCVSRLGRDGYINGSVPKHCIIYPH